MRFAWYRGLVSRCQHSGQNTPAGEQTPRRAWRAALLVKPLHGCPSRLRALLRVMGVAAIVAGTVIVGFSPNRWDVVIATLPRGHGVHSTDVIGTAFVALGIAVLWFSPRRR